MLISIIEFIDDTDIITDIITIEFHFEIIFKDYFVIIFALYNVVFIKRIIESC